MRFVGGRMKRTWSSNGDLLMGELYSDLPVTETGKS